MEKGKPGGGGGGRRADKWGKGCEGGGVMEFKGRKGLGCMTGGGGGGGVGGGGCWCM